MEKVLVFIKNKDNNLLLLKGSDNDPQFHESFWYTVTGGKEDKDASLIDTAKREVKEETNLNVSDIMYLNWILKYESLGTECEEYVFICDIESELDIVLNEENIAYKWCGVKEFVNLIKWYTDKADLQNILGKALTNEQYFEREIVTTIN